MKTKKKLKAPVGEPVDGPAVIGADHVQDRVLGKAAGARKGWSKLTVYEREFRLGHLRCKERCATKDGAEAEGRLEADRFAAARAFDLGWQLCTASWPGGSTPRPGQDQRRGAGRLCRSPARGQTVLAPGGAGDGHQ